MDHDMHWVNPDTGKVEFIPTPSWALIALGGAYIALAVGLLMFAGS